LFAYCEEAEDASGDGDDASGVGRQRVKGVGGVGGDRDDRLIGVEVGPGRGLGADDEGEMIEEPGVLECAESLEPAASGEAGEREELGGDDASG
jgi:hypothetical protein